MYIYHPKFNPIIFSVGPFSAHWYGFMYVISFLFSVWYLKKNVMKKEEAEKLFFFIIIGSCIGGHIGYIIFYNFSYFLRNLFYVFEIWKGGMSFHGGLIGSVIAILLYAKKNKKNFLKISDAIVPLVPIGLGAGRLG
ncbi:prolipoprotein diacylglyceryl transferase, partial [Buchnera aphidicola]|nr:prolipoprotein diacylglyceryl transferase [Buchnera aphidicola]